MEENMFRKKAMLFAAVVLLVATLLSTMSFAGAVKAGTITASSGLYVRASASTSSAALGVLAKGANVIILEKIDDWYRISYDGEDAYVSAAYVDTNELSGEVMAGEVTASYLYLRSAASKYSTALGGVTKGNSVIIIGTEGNWHKVISNGQIGYMSAEYIIPSTDTVASLGYGKIVTSGSPLSMRFTPVDGYVIASIPKDEIVTITGVKGGWYRVEYDGKTGYVSPSYVLPVSEDDVITPEQQRYLEILEAGNKIVEEAMKYLGIQYVWGGSTPTQGFDCSGLTQWVYSQCGITLRVRTQQYLDGEPVTYDELMPGDLVFFRTTSGSTISHVGIYVGDGDFIHAPSVGYTVRVQTMASGYYYTHFAFGRRFV